MRLFWKLLFLLVVGSFFLWPSSKVWAASNSFVTVVNPVRGNDFWELKDQRPVDGILGEAGVLQQANTPATWLIRFDALQDQEIVRVLKSLPQRDELGLFLEVTPTWTKGADITYRSSESWHFSKSALLTGYTTSEREKLIDASFVTFKQTFGFYPQSVGAWYIDSYSLGYMQQKYGVSAALIVADQHSTDSYQVWGQYWSTPYYPGKKDALMPAQTLEDKLPVVVMQWAARDPVNGYGKGVEESTYSVQLNDYLDYHGLSTDYFSSLVNIYTTQTLNQFGQVVVGLENSYSWRNYQSEYQRQIKVLSDKERSEQLSLKTMKDFAGWYKQNFKDLSPAQVIVAWDPLKTSNFAVWFMNPYYRAGWFVNREGSVFRDVRPYGGGREEQCYSAPCDKLSFATFALWTIDEITRGQKKVLDAGRVEDIQVVKKGDKVVLTYQNEAGRKRTVEFLPRDISVDGKIQSIDSFILEATAVNQGTQIVKEKYPESSLKIPGRSLVDFSLSVVKFIIFFLIAIFIPGWVLTSRIKEELALRRLFLAASLGLVGLTLISYLSGYINLSWIIYLYLGLFLAVFFVRRHYRDLRMSDFHFNTSRINIGVLLLILAGTFFQSLSMIRSGWVYDFGLGFWGPIGHDGIWHQALINQLMEKVPPQNPGFSGTVLSNYHYFFDLLVAVTASLSKVSVLDLLYRFYPVVFSSLTGIGTYFLVMKLFQKKVVTFITLYFVYFAGSFGWIVEFIRERHFGGESAFWANQPVSANLNPPFALSLVLTVTFLILFANFIKRQSLQAGVLLALIAGSLVEFKVYAGVIVLGSFTLIAFLRLIKDKDGSLIKVALGGVLLALAVFLPQNSNSADLLVFSPFWFVHSMVDFPDRVGWERLALARQMAPLQKNWFKYLAVEGSSLLLFVVGNLGTRFVALFPMLGRKNWKDELSLLILLMTAVSLLIPTFFIQKGNPWNTIQFFYYFIYFVALFTGAAIFFLWQKLPRLVGLITVGLILLLAPINAVVTFQSYFSASPPSRLTGGEWTGLQFLKKLPPGVVLTYPYDKNQRGKFSDPFPLLIYETSNYVSAFSNKPAFVEDEIQQEILQNDYQKRLVASTDFWQGRDQSWSEKFLRENNIRYLYLPRIFRVNVDINTLKLKKIYDNGEVSIYQTSI